MGPTSPDSAVTLDGYNGYLSTAIQLTNPGASGYSVEVWFKTADGYNRGGKLIGFQQAQTGVGTADYDRMIFMTNAGNIIFGNSGSTTNELVSSSSYNDGNWHYAVGVYNGTSNVYLYVDGSQVASSTSDSAPTNYSGYWRMGYGQLAYWADEPTSAYFGGSLGEAAVYTSALSATQVSNHYNAAGGGSYDATVLNDGPAYYWKLNDASGSTAADSAGANDGTYQKPSDLGTYQGDVTYGVAGPSQTGDTAVQLDGSTGYVSSAIQFLDPTPYSVEIWFKTPKGYGSGGKLIGFQQAQTGLGGSNYDRMIYMTNAGNVVFGNSGNTTYGLASPNVYNDGNWHYAVGVWDGTNVHLYIDGSQVASGSDSAPANYSGYWRIGYGNIAYWPNVPSSAYFGGSLGEAAVYPYALSATQVFNHYAG